MKKQFIYGILYALTASFTYSDNVRFTAPASGNIHFSKLEHWNKTPKSKDTLRSINRTSNDRPANLNSDFEVDFGNIYIAPETDGTSYLNILESGKLEGINLYVGHSLQPARGGHVEVHTGGNLRGHSGRIIIGAQGSGALTLEPNCNVTWPGLDVHPNGTLLYKMGPQTSPTIYDNGHREKKNIINGQIQVDMAKLTNSGTYLLLDSDVSQISGNLYKWIDDQGGRASGVGDFHHKNFSTLNASEWNWTLSIEDEGRDLLISIHNAQQNSEVTNPLPPMIDPNTWDIESWRAWPFDYKLLSQREAPLSIGNPIDWVHIGDSWVAKSSTKNEAPVSSGIEEYQDLVVTDFYISAGGNQHGANRIYCATAVPKGVKDQVPVLLVFHGGGGHASGALALAVARNNIGFATVAIDYNGQFRPSKSPVTEWVTVTENLRKPRLDLIPNQLNFPMYHYTQASRRVLDWVEEQVWADSNRMGVIGISYGGWVSCFLAGNDSRIKSIYTQVSAGGTDGMRGRSSNSHNWQPNDQREIWKSVADPIAYASAFQGRTFFRIAANDRFFWLDGAARHREKFPNKAQWMITPNSDHGIGGPGLPDPAGLWHRSVYMNEPSFPSFPSFGNIHFSKDHKKAIVSITAKRPLKSVNMAWSPGNSVSVARYWRWIEATEHHGEWSAEIPPDFKFNEGVIYFTAVDIEGRTISSDLVIKQGARIETPLTWENGCLWDQSRGADAWRADLSFGKITFEDGKGGGVKVTPVEPDSRVRFLTNSLHLDTEKFNSTRGISLSLDGHGTSFPLRIILAQDFLSLDSHSLVASVQVPAEASVLELNWDLFKSDSSATSTDQKLSINSLAVQAEILPKSGLTIGSVIYLD